MARVAKVGESGGKEAPPHTTALVRRVYDEFVDLSVRLARLLVAPSRVGGEESDRTKGRKGDKKTAPRRAAREPGEVAVNRLFLRIRVLGKSCVRTRVHLCQKVAKRPLALRREGFQNKKVAAA